MLKGGEVCDEENTTTGKSVVYELYDESVATKLPEVKGRRLTTNELVKEVLYQNDRSPRTGLGRLLLKKETLDIISDTFWWVFLRFVSDSCEPVVDELQPKPPPLPPSRRTDRRNDGAKLPLHMYPQTFPAVTRSIDALSRLAAPGSIQNGIPTEEICSCASSPRGGDRGGDSSGGSVASEADSHYCKSLLSAGEMLTPRPPPKGAALTGTTSAMPSPRCRTNENGDLYRLSLSAISKLPPFEKEDLISDEEQLRYNRISKNYIKIVEFICKVQPAALQDMYYTQYPDIIAQVVCLAMHKSNLPTPDVTKKEVLGFTTYWMSGVQRKDISGWKIGRHTSSKKIQKKATAAAGKKPTPAKRLSESSAATGLGLEELSKELDNMKKEAQAAFNKKMKASKLGMEQDNNQDDQPRRIVPLDRGHVTVMGSIKKLKPLQPRVVSLLRGLRQNKSTPAWFEFGRVGFRKKAAKVGVGNFCTTDYSPLVQQALIQRLDNSYVKPADMLWSCHNEAATDNTVF
eukprot:TRINITY_DN1348_c2_g1_i2.p1 TRINITY_DN1348_c2_g1~~TRINITY_DN1348_c2_g1_i2.p1  ORF type:complete len:516 (+),score=111.35 TRINITY_DN1348_c2_g1_i2:105-1652(+)